MSTRAQIYYGTDVTDSQWALIEPLLPEAKGGSGRQVGHRVIGVRSSMLYYT